MTAHYQQQRFDRWLQDHAAILHHVANAFATGHDRHDLMQELLLAIWKSIPAFRADSQPSTFIYRVSHNAALTWRRASQNYRRKIESYEAQPHPEFAPPAANVTTDTEMLEHLYARIRELPPLDRSLLLLSLDGVSYRDMAEIHGLTETNVGARLNRAKQNLIQSLKGIAHELR